MQAHCHISVILSLKQLREKKNTPFQYYFVSIRFVTTTNFYIFAQLLHYNNYIIFGIMMNKNQIGTNASIVWKLLSDNAHWEYDKLKHASGLSDRDLNAAIGWLAREDKIDFDIASSTTACFYMSMSISANTKYHQRKGSGGILVLCQTIRFTVTSGNS